MNDPDKIPNIRVCRELRIETFNMGSRDKTGVRQLDPVCFTCGGTDLDYIRKRSSLVPSAVALTNAECAKAYGRGSKIAPEVWNRTFTTTMDRLAAPLLK